MISDKITPDHLSRKALVYVRQSTMGQVRHHRESQRRQYALADTARAMGWRTVEVIDEDLGRSGTTAAGRSGFARVVAAVSYPAPSTPDALAVPRRSDGAKLLATWSLGSHRGSAEDL